MCYNYDLISDELMNELTLLLEHYNNYSNEWNKLKNVIVFSIPSRLRAEFSRRANYNKKHPNALEHQIMQWWANNTQQTIIFTDGDTIGEVKPNNSV